MAVMEAVPAVPTAQTLLRVVDQIKEQGFDALRFGAGKRDVPCCILGHLTLAKQADTGYKYEPVTKTCRDELICLWLTRPVDPYPDNVADHLALGRPAMAVEDVAFALQREDEDPTKAIVDWVQDALDYSIMRDDHQD